MAELEKQVCMLEEEVKTIKLRCEEQERYKRRWNLQVKGLEEKVNEDTRAVVIPLHSMVCSKSGMEYG